MSSEVHVTTLPECDFCKSAGYQPVRKAGYDFRTIYGSWANACREHYWQYRASKQLGTGNGQKLRVK